MSPFDKPIAECGICASIEHITAGRNQDFIAELPRSFVVLAWQQFYRGYCIMFAKRHVTELFLMPRDELRELYGEITEVAASIAAVVNPWKMNYECLGNAEPHVHWHLIPRYENDPRRNVPIWVRPDGEIRIPLAENDHAALIKALRTKIKSRINDARIG